MGGDALTKAAIDMYNKCMVYPRNYSWKEQEKSLDKRDELVYNTQVKKRKV